MSDGVLPVEVERVDDGGGLPVEKAGSFQARSVQVRSKLGEDLYGLIRADLPDFYKVIRDAAFGESEDIPKDRRGRPSRSYGTFLATHRKMFIDLMKIANADVSVDAADFKGDIESFKRQLKDLSTDDLRKLVGAAEKANDGGY